MAERGKAVNVRRGLGRAIVRAPVWLYRFGLGGLLGRRFLLLRHTGRKSGLPRQTVLEVMRFDRDAKAYYVCSGWGAGSDWLRNILAAPEVVIETGGERLASRVEQLTVAEGTAELLDYARQHPNAFRELSRVMGYRLEGGEDEIREIGKDLPVVRFSPR